jgi:hypothetical protein
VYNRKKHKKIVNLRTFLCEVKIHHKFRDIFQAILFPFSVFALVFIGDDYKVKEA